MLAGAVAGQEEGLKGCVALADGFDQRDRLGTHGPRGACCRLRPGPGNVDGGADVHLTAPREKRGTNAHGSAVEHANDGPAAAGTASGAQRNVARRAGSIEHLRDRGQARSEVVREARGLRRGHNRATHCCCCPAAAAAGAAAS